MSVFSVVLIIAAVIAVVSLFPGVKMWISLLTTGSADAGN